MYRSTTRSETSFGDVARPPTVALLAVAIGAVYLWWRSSTLGVGSVLILSIPVLAIEIWSFLELSFLTAQSWRSPSPTKRGESGREHEPIDIAIVAAGADVDELERTLVACRAIRSRGRLVVIDDARRYRPRSLASDAGATYRIDRRAAEVPGLAAHRNTGSERYLWLTAGQLPRPDLVEVVSPRFDRDDLAVCQLATSLLNSDDLAHLGRDRDDDALVNQVIGPCLSRWDAGPWLGSASVVRREAIEAIGGFDRFVPVERLVARLHRAGWATAFEQRQLVATTAPEAIDRYLAHRRQRAGAALSVVLSGDGPLMPGGSMSIGQRVAHLGAALRFGTGVRLLAVAVAAVAVLISGVFPADASLPGLVAFWGLTTAAGAVGRRAISRRSNRLGDWIHQGWRVLGAEVGAVADVVGRRVSPAATEPEPAQAATGLRALAHLPLLDAVILTIDLVLLGRALTIVDHDLLPPFPTGERLIVFGFTLALLVPIVRVLQVVVVRQQRRSHYRIAVELDATLDGTPARTLDLTPEGAGILLSYEPKLGATTSLEISLPGADGVVRRIVGRAMVRSARPDGDDRWRVGVELLQLAPAARHALTTFCARQPVPDGADEPELVPVVDPVAAAQERRRRSVRRITFGAGLAGLATVVFGPGIASASTFDAGLVEQVCVVDTEGLPVIDVAVERLVGEEPQVLGSTDLIGCMTVGADPATTGFAVSHRGARMPLQPGHYQGSLAQVALVAWQVDVVDLDAAPVAGAEVRFFTDRWLLASPPTDPEDGHRFQGLPVDPALQQIEVRLDTVRFVRTMDDRVDQTVVLPRVRLFPADAATSVTDPAIDRGRGWEPLTDGQAIVPGPTVFRLADGQVLRIDVPESHEVILPDGVLVPVEDVVEEPTVEDSPGDGDPETETDISTSTSTSTPTTGAGTSSTGGSTVVSDDSTPTTTSTTLTTDGSSGTETPSDASDTTETTTTETTTSTETTTTETTSGEAATTETSTTETTSGETTSSTGVGGAGDDSGGAGP